MPIKEGYEALYYITLFIIFGGAFLIALSISKRTGKSPFLHLIGVGITLGKMKFWERLVLILLLFGGLMALVNIIDTNALRHQALQNESSNNN